MSGDGGVDCAAGFDVRSQRQGQRMVGLRLHPDRDAYETRVAQGIDQLLQAGWLLTEDIKPTFDAAIARWEWAIAREGGR